MRIIEKIARTEIKTYIGHEKAEEIAKLVKAKLDLKTAEILKQIKARGFYDDFIEMMDKDCFDEAASVYASAEESVGADY